MKKLKETTNLCKKIVGTFSFTNHSFLVLKLLVIYTINPLFRVWAGGGGGGGGGSLNGEGGLFILPQRKEYKMQLN
jgi:hypothetical protein